VRTEQVIAEVIGHVPVPASTDPGDKAMIDDDRPGAFGNGPVASHPPMPPPHHAPMPAAGGMRAAAAPPTVPPPSRPLPDPSSPSPW
jgi:hypothetical protein